MSTKPTSPTLIHSLRRRSLRWLAPVGAAAVLGLGTLAATPAHARNFIIIVVDGLRHGSVNSTDAPTLSSIRANGVNFVNSHSIFPTFTTPNASAIATGHYLGDTGDFSNTIYVGYPIFGGTQTPFIESDPNLGDIDLHFGGSFLDEETLLAYARTHGFNTAAVGKLGPVLIQDVTQGNPVNGAVPPPDTIIIDDSTGRTGGVPLAPAIAQTMQAAGLPLVAPDRTNGQPAASQGSNGFSGNNQVPGTLAANVVQQQFFTDAITRAILPTFQQNGKPFGMVYWSRDADGSQHNQGDSLNSLTPGINGPTSRASIKNADNNIAQILAYLNSVPGLAADTDIFVTADHGFSTISHHEVNAQGAFTNSYAASRIYKDATGRQEVNNNFLPAGFVALDLARALGLPLFDPDTIVTSAAGVRFYKPVDPTQLQTGATVAQRPVSGDGFIGGTGAILTPTDASVVVAANGGSDLIYLPRKDQGQLERIVDFLSRQDYVSGLYVDPDYGTIPGALSLADINLKGSTQLPTPALVVNFRSFALDPMNPAMTGVTVADSSLQEGQGMHGAFSRADTFNNMAAIGPDFKGGFVDAAPISNADVAITLAHILGFNLPANGELTGRVLSEALVNGPDTVAASEGVVESAPSAGGKKTSLFYQQVGPTRYFTASGTPGQTGGLPGLSIADTRETEGDADRKKFVFTVTLSEPSPEPVTVGYATADGSARAGTDYLTREGRLTFAPGETTQTIKVPVFGNTTARADARFFVDLFEPTRAGTARDRATATVVNDDPVPLTGNALTLSDGAGQSFSGVVASFSPAFANATPASTFTATIGWGDGTKTVGTVTVNGVGGYDVTGEHLYAQPGTFKVKVKITGSNGVNAKALSTADVHA